MTIKSGGEGKSPGQAEWWTNFVTLRLPAAGYQLNGTAKLRARDCRTCVADYDFGIAGIFPAYLDSDIFVTWSIVPAEIEEVEVVVDPVGHPKPIPHGEWLPEGNLKNWNEVGNMLQINARLQTKEGGTPQTIKASKFTFTLLDVSHEPGVCMNRPIKSFADSKADLRFDPLLNGPPFVAQPLVWLDEFTVETSPDASGLIEAEAMVASYDFGAYGKLKVTAEVAGRLIVGYLKGDAAKAPGEILLPKRKPDSKIADHWKDTNSVSSLQDTDDSENDPVGDEHKGDGLTLYEEYRGDFHRSQGLGAGGSRPFGPVSDLVLVDRGREQHRVLPDSQVVRDGENALQ